MTAAISTYDLSKSYRIGELHSAYGTLRDSLAGAARRFVRRERGSDYEEIWALRDVSFEVPEGQVVGIIGKNGAGKSTLLKILTRITTPTAGRVEIRGRVGSLLEVGTGFHPELTGRENVFLNGSVLGMKRQEIQRKFDEIVEFSGVERFIDTPVKRYSSGMSVRLAFAVAAHLEPEILLVDEVLAVGDAEFQRRCLGRMEDLSDSGRTIVFVSHQMQAVAQLCDRAILLEKGSVVLDGAERRRRRPVPAGGRRLELDPVLARSMTTRLPGTMLCDCGPSESSTRTARRSTPRTCATPSASRSRTRSFSRMAQPSFRSSSSTTRGETSSSTRSTRTRDGRRRLPRETTRRRPGSQRTCSTKV